MNPWSILVALDGKREAEGELYLDDGVSQEPTEIKEIKVRTDSELSGLWNQLLTCE